MAYVLSTTTMQDCPPLPECPECGGLECLCRPRFFAGQLLTEQDLNRLESYIVEKNKLLSVWEILANHVACIVMDLKPSDEENAAFINIIKNKQMIKY